ncbi:MAG: FkbM family methyltransferase [Flavobacteriales bacterium]
MSSLTKRLLFPLLPAGMIRALRKKHYLRKFQELTGSDEPEMKVIASLIKHGDHVLDIGANFGAYTKFLSEAVGELGSVNAFEPIPEVFGYLESNVKSLSCKNVTLHNCALSDKSGEAEFTIPKFDHSGENFYEAHLTEGTGDIKVHVKRLDELELPEKVSFIKCDVEGAEINVLKGAKAFIYKHRPVWMLEMNEGTESITAKEIISFLESYNYKLKFLGNEVLTDKSSSFQGVNYFFIPE